MCQLLKKLLFISFILNGPSISWALPDDGKQTLHIVANSSVINYKTGFNLYEGNVIVTQGSTTLLADRLTTQNNKHHKIELAIAYGTKKPAEYQTKPKSNDPLFHAKAAIIKFYPIQSNVILEGNVIVTQGDNSFKGPIVFYNIKDQVVTAPRSQKGRATIMIEPT